MVSLGKLRGLQASDRSKQEQNSINQQMGYKQQNTVLVDENQNPYVIQQPVQQPQTSNALEGMSSAGAMLQRIKQYNKQLDNQYLSSLNDFQEQYGVFNNSVNTNAVDYIQKVARENSSFYKKFQGTDKLPLTGQDYMKLAAEYDARKKTYGEDNANIWLDGVFKNTVGENQSWYEQALNGFGSFLPTMEGAAVSTLGNVYGAINPILSLVDHGLDLPDNEDLGWWDNYWNNIIDNPITRKGDKITKAQTSYVGKFLTHDLLGISDTSASEDIENMKATATKYNPNGIGLQPIVTTDDQDNSWISSASPWQAIQSQGYTAFSMILGGGLAKAGSAIFKGATWAVKAAKTGKNLEKAMEGVRKFQNATEPFVIAGLVGTTEGAMEGLNTKIDVENEAVNNLDSFYKDKVAEEAKALYENDKLNPMIQTRTEQGYMMKKKYTPEQAYQETWKKYEKEYSDARRQIEWASSKAGIYNFWINSAVNGTINATLKAGLQAPRVQEALRNNRLTGWAYKRPKFNISEDGVVTPKISKAYAVANMLKEVGGEMLEEGTQGVSNDITSAAAQNNINAFIENRFNGDGTMKIAEALSSDWGAAANALGESVTSLETMQAAVLGGLGSIMGTPMAMGRGYHRDANGNIKQNGTFDYKNFIRGYNSDGTQESWGEYARRVTPWRSGLINAYYDNKAENQEAQEMAATLTEWLKNPDNKAKWDGLAGTANWLTQIEKAIESNDQFGYRKAQMGKAINDVFMLNRLKGTKLYDSIIEDLQRSSQMDVSSDVAQNMIQKIRDNANEDVSSMSDNEIIEKIQDNANTMLGIMSDAERESKSIDQIFGRIDDDTRQSLVFGKIMEKNFQERQEKLEEEIDNVKSSISSSRGRSEATLDEDLKELILKYGSVKKAMHAQSKLQEEKDKLKKESETLQKISKDKRSDAQNKKIEQNEKRVSAIDKELQTFDGLYEKDEKGKRTDNVNTSLLSMVFNEEEIMDLDPITRAIVLSQGSAKLYNALHQDRHAVDKVNLEINEVQAKIDKLQEQRKAWTTNDGKIKKHHNKQYEKIGKQIEVLEKEKAKKLRELDAVQGTMSTKPIYSDVQQEVIDNLVQQGMARDNDFLDKVVDMGRLALDIRNFHKNYQDILTNPNVFQEYVMRTKYNAAKDLTRRRAERVANITDFKEYSQELDKLRANASDQEDIDILRILQRKSQKQKADARKKWEDDKLANWQEDSDGQLVQDEETGEISISGYGYTDEETNYDRYMKNQEAQYELAKQMVKMPELTGNDQSLLMNAMQYLQSKGIDVTSDEAVDALVAPDEEGNYGGEFRQWVENKNSALPVEQRATMPVFTSIGQIASQYHNLLAGYTADKITKSNAEPTVTVAGTAGASPEESPTITPTPPPASPSATQQQGSTPQPKGNSIFNIGYSSADGGQFVDGNGTVATGTQVAMAEKHERANKEDEPQTDIEKAFWNITTPEIARMLNAVDTFIKDSKESKEVQDLARQYFMDIAVNSDEKFTVIDDVLAALQEQINTLKSMSNNQEEEDNKYNKTQAILQKAAGGLSAQSKRKRTVADRRPSRPENPSASWIHSANIAWMEHQNPGAWAVLFTNHHAIDEWNRDNTIGLDESIYFITDSDWTAEVTTQMNEGDGRDYDTLTDMPIVAAVKVKTPSNPNTTTAIEIDRDWYQPIAVMPSTKAKSSGALHTKLLRTLASKEQGRHLITADGMPNGSPLITHVYGRNYITANSPDDTTMKRENTKENNTDVSEDLFQFISRDEEVRLKSLPRKEMLNDPVYREARNKFLNGLSWDDKLNLPVYTADRLRGNGSASPMQIFRKDLAETKDRDTATKTLEEVLREGSLDDLIRFNSRTERLYNEIFRPLVQFLVLKDGKDISAKVITQEDVDTATAQDRNAYEEEAKRIQDILNGQHTRGVSNFLWITGGWSFRVTAPSNLQHAEDISNSTSVYKVILVNNDNSVIDIGNIEAGKNNTEAAKQMLKNLLFDGEDVRDFLKWQIQSSEVNKLNLEDTAATTWPRKNIGAMVDDGIFEMAGTSVVYDIQGIKLRNPFNGEGLPVYKANTVTNSDNALTAGTINVTPQAAGAIVTGGGEPLEPHSGADLGNGNNPPTPPLGTPPIPKHSEKYKKAVKTTEKIINDSKEFVLSEDEVYYYITDKNTGERKKYLRVTTVIGADRSLDEHSEQWYPTNKEIVEQLKQNHTLPEITAEQLDSWSKIDDMAKALGVSEKDIRRAIAELRTEHKHNKMGAWGVPSTAIGNTVDLITRDFLAGHLKESYPNISKSNLDNFVSQLTAFKNDLDSKGIHIVSEGIMAHGTITMTAEDGTENQVNVAGTLDLFGYDDDGNFYIFDMKTTRNHTAQKLLDEQSKWSRQVSMYASLLKQTYDVDVEARNLRIIPINVDYKAPAGTGRLAINNPQYSVDADGQLKMTYRNSKEPQNYIAGENGDGEISMRTTTLDGQFQPGFTQFNINFDNLSSEDQDVAAGLIAATGPAEADNTSSQPQEAHIETPARKKRSSFDLEAQKVSASKPGASIHEAPPVGGTETLPSWNQLSSAQKAYLKEEGIESDADYADMLNDAAWMESVKQSLKCRGLL